MGVQLKFFPNSRPFEIEYLKNATTSEDGAMSKEDKAKLDGIPPGGAGINAFTALTAFFVQPAASANVVVQVAESQWASIGQEIYVENGGYYRVAAKPSNTSLTLTNTGYQTNALPGSTIVSGSTVSPAGLRGATGVNAFTVVTIDFVQPAANSNVTVNVEDSTWMGVDQVIYVQNGGYYQAISFPTDAQAILKNLGYAGNAAPGASVLANSTISPGGLEGPSLIRLISTILNLPPGSVADLGPAATYPGVGVLAAYLVESAITISNYRITLNSGVADNSDELYQFSYSSDQGNTFTTVNFATLLAGNQAKTGVFPAVALSPGDIVTGAMFRQAGVGNFTTGAAVNLF